ncbi:MAG TPA: NAD(P)H-dependent glycerol-3-phosphate dehydrogenase [Blastocatellia bacterium]
MTIIGAGSWGTALALVAARNAHEVRMWAREPEVAQSIRQDHRNPYYLPEFELPPSITATTSLSEALIGADFCLLIVPSHVMREVAGTIRPYLKPDILLVTATKGIENGTLMRMSEVLVDVLGVELEKQIAVLSGPSFALEVARGEPTAIVAASRSSDVSSRVQQEFSSHLFRIYTNDDVVGVELGGALKNVVAIATGVVRGLGFGTNSAAAIITRGLAEVTRLSIACGARVETMAGLAGLGDLVLTCTGELSRNRYVGVELGRGRRLSEITSGMREIAEGVKTTKAIYELGRRMNIDMPITASMHALLYEDKPALEAASELMDRPLKHEIG